MVPLCFSYADCIADVFFAHVEEYIKSFGLHRTNEEINPISWKIVLSTHALWVDSGGQPEYKDSFVETAYKVIRTNKRYKEFLGKVASAGLDASELHPVGNRTEPEKTVAGVDPSGATSSGASENLLITGSRHEGAHQFQTDLTSLDSDFRKRAAERALAAAMAPVQGEANGGHDETALTVGKGDGTAGHTSSWEDIEIRFTSEHRVQIFVRGIPGDSMNFADMGFEDRRGGGGKPIGAWALLVDLSQNDGICSAAQVSSNQSIQKRAQEVRDRLAHRFQIAGDPLPFRKGTGYKSRFKIRRSPSFDT